MQINIMIRHLVCAAVLAACFSSTTAQAQRAAANRDRAAASQSGDLEARRLLDRAQELLQSGERERGVKMVETVLEQYPASRMVYPACLALGKHYISANQQMQAISFLNRLRVLEPEDKLAEGEDRELLLESMYLIGVAYFQTRQYNLAFPVLRHITSKYPNTMWANQAHYYIGMCHFAQQNWNKAIEALSLVGTFVDPTSPTTAYAEAGRRFYVKVEDPDFPVMLALGKRIVVTLATSNGDREEVECIPLTADAQMVIGSITTAIGPAKPGDRILQVIGGDEIAATYVDESTESGETNVKRASKVKIVSTGALNFMLGDFEGAAAAAFLGQPLFVQLIDIDLDTTDLAETVKLTAVSRYRARSEDDEQLAFVNEEDLRWEIRDRVEVTLTETGGTTAGIRTGRFNGAIDVQQAHEDKPSDRSDSILEALVGDEILITYTDELHIGGESPRLVETTIQVVGEVDNRPRATQDIVFDAVLRARKNLVEATAFLELSRIFHSMGLLKGTKEKAAEGLQRVESIIRARGQAIPSELKQEAFKLKWELHMEAEDLGKALATCSLFSQLFPQSPMVDDALMGIAKIRVESEKYTEAIEIFRQITRLKHSEAKAEAQFRIAQTMELAEQRSKGNRRAQSGAIQEYKICAERYPESPYAGESLAKLIDYNISKGDFPQANSLLEQTFQDYPDASFLDSMLMKLVLVAYQSGDFAKAREKCNKLLFEYPESRHAETARQVLPRIEARLQ